MKNQFSESVFCLLLTAVLCSATGVFAELGDQPVTCEGWYPGHLQGVDWDRRNAIYWSFTSVLVKTDLAGRVVQKVDVPGHHGDLCFRNGQIFVAVNFGNFNDAKGNADNKVYIYDADKLKLLAKHEIPQVKHGAGGMTWQKGRFIVVGGLPAGVEENYFYEYDNDFLYLGRKVVQSGYTRLGIQAVTSSNSQLWCGCYGNALLCVTDDYQLAGRWEFDCGYGLIYLRDDSFMITRGLRDKNKGRSALLLPARSHSEKGFQLLGNQ